MSDELLSTPRFRVQRVKRQLADGTVKQREVIRHPGSVVILPLLGDRQVCLIRNYRVAVDRPLIELPAGTLEPGEPPIHCAERELREETGYRASHLQHMTSFFAAPGILDEQMHLFLATQLTAGKPQREVGEEIENHIVPFTDALDQIRRGEIQDAKTLVGLLYYQMWPHDPTLSAP